jgi:hypothetical protein
LQSSGKWFQVDVNDINSAGTLNRRRLINSG